VYASGPQAGQEVPQDQLGDVRTMTLGPQPDANDPRQIYIAERERLRAPMVPPGRYSQRYMSTQAESEIRSALSLPAEHKITREDAERAALETMVSQHEIHSNAQALNVISRQNALVQSFEKTAQLNANLVTQLGPKGVAGGPLLWNRLQQWTRREIEVDPDITKLDTALTAFKNEFVKIMSTSAGQGAMSSDESRREGEKRFNVNLPWEVLKGNITVARQDMKNRTDSIRDAYTATVNAIHGKGKFPEQLEPLPEEGTLPTAPAQRSSTMEDAKKQVTDNFLKQMQNKTFNPRLVSPITNPDGTVSYWKFDSATKQLYEVDERGVRK
jgi:hypothetical protein